MLSVCSIATAIISHFSLTLMLRYKTQHSMARLIMFLILCLFLNCFFFLKHSVCILVMRYFESVCAHVHVHDNIMIVCSKRKSLYMCQSKVLLATYEYSELVLSLSSSLVFALRYSWSESTLLLVHILSSSLLVPARTSSLSA